MHAQLLTGAAPIRSALQDRTVASRLAGIVARRHAGPRFSPSARCAAILHRGLMTLASTDDRDALNSLLAATAQRDQRAFAELYRRTSPKLYGICLRVLRTRGEAEGLGLPHEPATATIHTSEARPRSRPPPAIRPVSR